MTYLITKLQKFSHSVLIFFGNYEKKLEHEWHLNELHLKKESLEQNHEKELESLDKDIGVLFNRRHIEEMTEGEVMHEWDKRRGDIRERQFKEIRYIENDILYYQELISKIGFSEFRKEIIYPLLIKSVTFFFGFLFGIIAEHFIAFSKILDWF